jgi:hypothetical protein
MSRRLRLLLCAVLGVAATTCGTSSTLVQRWSEPTYVGSKGQKMMVVALAQNERGRHMWEEAFSTALRSVKVTPVAGSTALPLSGEADESTLKQAIRDSGVNLVAVSRLVDVEKEQVYVPGSTYYTPAPSYYGMYGYYHNSYGMVSTPGYYQENKIYKLETNVYDVKTEKLVWSGLTETVNPETAQEGANSVIQIVIGDMIASKVIAK